MINELIKIFDRDLDKLKMEIESFKEEDNLWIIKGEIANSAGNLCMHLIGNLNTYIGKNIGHYKYERDREAEFNAKHIPRKKLLADIMDIKSIINSSLKNLDPKSLNEPYIENVLGYEMTNTFFLIHLTAHFSYHLGQINYLRRILETD